MVLTHLKTAKIPFLAATLLLLATVPRFAHCEENTYKGRLGLSLDGGYTSLPIPVIADAEMAHGGTARLRLFYGLSEVFGIEVAAGSTWFSGYTPLSYSTEENEGGEDVDVATKLSDINGLRAQSLSFSVIYTLDIMKIIPYVALGVGSLRTRHLQDKVAYVYYDVSLHADFGFDYRLREFLWLGAAFSMDTSLTQYSPYSTFTGVFLRATWVWQVRKLRKKADTR